ncbi:hypothetical protein BSKO_05310 [Bryopsis sp. KO-2023]|nr:hypothetical protein BSKO_05310 [Bryopsis sp. KO-2023]
MVSEEWVVRSIQAGKSYEELPARLRSSLPLVDWKAKVKSYCIDRGYGWSDSLASTSCGENEYYEALIEFYTSKERIFPYHLAHYVCRVLRMTPFRYYSDILFNSLKLEKAYDKIPNFTAADILRVVGIGRNEYIAILDSCKAKKLLWRVNKGVAKEKLPAEPVNIPMEPWWKIGVVNVSEQEFQGLNNEELDTLQNACNGSGLEVGEIDPDLMRSLYRRGLLFLRVPVREDDRFTIPSLEGFVSNRDVASDGVDPMESLLYSVFVANSENVAIGNLARVLNVDIRDLRAAMSIACRLGFSSRVKRDPPQGDDTLSCESFPLNNEGDEAESMTDKEREVGPSSGEGRAVALVVDAETTSYLMMGALSPGVKRHAVTLFEAGKVAGDEVIAELIAELRSSVMSCMKLEGEMIHLTNHASALATALDCARVASGGRSIELLRKESLVGLAPGAIQRVFSHSYKVVLPVTPLPGDPLPLISGGVSPVYFGPSGPVASPWFQLAMYQSVRQGPVSIVFMRGQRVHELPSIINTCSLAFLRVWGPVSKFPVVVGQPFLLHYLNTLLKTNAVMLQPLCSDALGSDGKIEENALVDVPLPFSVSSEEGRHWAKGFYMGSGEEVQIGVPSNLEAAIQEIGLDRSIGFLRMMHLQNLGEASEDDWVPIEVHVGLPIHAVGLCGQVCRVAGEQKLLDTDNQILQVTIQHKRKELLEDIMWEYGASWGPERGDRSKAAALPACNFMFDGKKLGRMDFGDCLQGSGLNLQGGAKPIRPDTVVA